MSDATNAYLPDGRYFVTNRSSSFMSGEPGTKLTIPRDLPVLKSWRLERVPSIPELYIYILSNDEETPLYLGTTIQPTSEDDAKTDEFPPRYATTTTSKDEAWQFTLESVYRTQDKDTTETPNSNIDEYFLVQHQSHEVRQLLTVHPDFGISTPDTVFVEYKGPREAPAECIWKLTLVLGPPADTA